MWLIQITTLLFSLRDFSAQTAKWLYAMGLVYFLAVQQPTKQFARQIYTTMIPIIQWDSHKSGTYDDY